MISSSQSSLAGLRRLLVCVDGLRCFGSSWRRLSSAVTSKSTARVHSNKKASSPFQLLFQLEPSFSHNNINNVDNNCHRLLHHHFDHRLQTKIGKGCSVEKEGMISVFTQLVPRSHLSTSSVQSQSQNSNNNDDVVHVVFKDGEGGSEVCKAKVGDTILDVALFNDIDIEGACGGTIACSTCHVIVDKEWYDKLEPPEEEEEDMLDLAYDLQETSRLGCQIVLTKELDNMEVTLPMED
eukprot:m.69872 g.69872  ORF g.69872 m.69872 type:complete len:238 (-) comp11648_c0_seq1:152-865(-)